MHQRTIAAVIAVPLVLAMLFLVFLVPLPYAVYSPGPTFDILGKDANEAEIVQVDGHKTYRDEGQIRFTTVQSSPRDSNYTLPMLMFDWFDPDNAVVPYEVVHPEDQTAEEEQVQGAISMVTSQDTAVAVALGELDYEVRPTIQVAHVDDGGPAFGELRVRDQIVEVDGEPVRIPEGGDAQGAYDTVVDAVGRHGPGDPVELVVVRDGRRLTVPLEPEEIDGEMRIGISLGVGFDFPFDVTFNVDPSIGGPSAGLMFALAVYDTLTPGPLTDGETVAGTGELRVDGSVGPIGGIQQKIAAAEDAGAELFFVPPDNCADVDGLDPDLELVKATTMHEARLALDQWSDDRDADLPSC